MTETSYNEIENGICQKRKEVKIMPGRDGTGPYRMAGGDGNSIGYGCRRGMGRGAAGGYRGLGLGPCGIGMSDESRKEYLKLQKEALGRAMDSIDRQLNDR